MPAENYQLAFASFRLQFTHPFRTAHGSRDGTDAVFVRISNGNKHGFGEATLPPYLSTSADDVIRALHKVDIEDHMRSVIDGRMAVLPQQPLPARAALSTAAFDLRAKELGKTLRDLLLPVVQKHVPARYGVTLGLSDHGLIDQKIKELPRSGFLKVKLDGTQDIEVVSKVQMLDQRLLLLDVNQGWNSVDEAIRVLDRIDTSKVCGIEQPFKFDRWDQHGELQARTEIPVYGDESIEDMHDLERSAGSFGGVNIKLMKCGGLDVAVRMAQRAKQLGMSVMLGCMSESALGCGAMSHIQTLADLVDLDGPWLLRNDPFTGLHIGEEGLVVDKVPGIGVTQIALLDWQYIGA